MSATSLSPTRRRLIVTAAAAGAAGLLPAPLRADAGGTVLAPSSQGQSIRFRVKLGGAPPGKDRGSDVDADGWGSVRDARLYQLVRQTGAIDDQVSPAQLVPPADGRRGRYAAIPRASGVPRFPGRWDRQPEP
jgi:hypothetical protein